MAVIYKDFAKGLDALNATAFSPHSTLVNGSRAYIINGHPYFDRADFCINGECDGDHEIVQRYLKKRDTEERVYLGFAGEVNLTNMAVTKTPAAVLGGINPFQKIFWKGVFSTLASNPEPENFAEHMLGYASRFYKKLTKTFNLETLQKHSRRLEFDIPRTGDPIFLDEEKRVRNALWHNFASSPIRNMGYGDFAHWLGMRAGWRTGWEYKGDPDLNWIKDKDLYGHLHSLAKNNAVGFLTLDICDPESCGQLRDYMNSVAYTPFDVRSGASGPTKTGAKFGTMYLSNIAYYLDWSAEQLAQEKNLGAVCDYTKREIDTHSWERTTQNLLPLVADDALVIRFDRVSGSGTRSPQFHPLFELGGNMHIPGPLEKGGLVADIA